MAYKRLGGNMTRNITEEKEWRCNGIVSTVMSIPLKIAYVTISFVAFMVRRWFAGRCSLLLAQSIQLHV
jgi:hypothetical protein